MTAARAIATQHVDWALRDGMTTTDIAYSIGIKTLWPTRDQCVRWIAEIVDADRAQRVE
jgi:hypothetical protein